VEDSGVAAQKLLNTICRPLIVDGQELSISASIGVCVFPDDGLRAGELIRNAEAALYRAKNAGRNAYQFYTPQMNAQATQRLQTENALRLALERHELQLYYQPQVDVLSGAIVGAEALLRWERPGIGFVPPDQFIPIAEERGLILAIDRWAVREAIRQLKAWDAAGLPEIALAVNVSASEFHQKGFGELLAKTVREHGIAASRLELELTESVAIQDVEATTAILHQLHKLGFSLSLDDFGTGYSSLSYLRRFPIDKIKIDRTFVRELTVNAEALRIVRAIIGLSKSFTMKVVAEGVETRDQLDALRAESCDHIQGYVVSPALPAESFADFVRTWKPGT
jgi:EAL domain-containing protein (putative c-di-GMP-specific phosphodiesterase class I)